MSSTPVSNNPVRVTLACCDECKRLVVDGNDVLTAKVEGLIFNSKNPETTYETDVKVNNQNYKVKFEVDLHKKGQKFVYVTGEKAAVEKFYSKTHIKWGTIEENGKTTALDIKAYTAINHRHRCFTNLTQTMHSFHEDAYLFITDPATGQRYRPETGNTYSKDSRDHYSLPMLSAMSCRTGEIGLNQNEVLSLSKPNVTRIMVKSHRKQLEEIVEGKFQSEKRQRAHLKKLNTIFNVPSDDVFATKPPQSDALNLSSEPVEGSDQFTAMAPDWGGLWNKYTELCRDLIAKEETLNALDMIAEENAKRLGSSKIVFDPQNVLSDPFNDDDGMSTGYKPGSKLPTATKMKPGMTRSQDPVKQQEAKFKTQQNEFQQIAAKNRKEEKENAADAASSNPMKSDLTSLGASRPRSNSLPTPSQYSDVPTTGEPLLPRADATSSTAGDTTDSTSTTGTSATDTTVVKRERRHSTSDMGRPRKSAHRAMT